MDITTIGARSHEPRRIEIWFHNVDGAIYITGLPGPRGWYANPLAHPQSMFHLKHGVRADLPATATRVADPDDRAELFDAIITGIDGLYARRGSHSRGGARRPLTHRQSPHTGRHRLKPSRCGAQVRLTPQSRSARKWIITDSISAGHRTA